MLSIGALTLSLPKSNESSRATARIVSRGKHLAEATISSLTKDNNTSTDLVRTLYEKEAASLRQRAAQNEGTLRVTTDC